MLDASLCFSLRHFYPSLVSAVAASAHSASIPSKKNLVNLVNLVEVVQSQIASKKKVGVVVGGFEIGSLTKIFTACALALSVRKGMVDPVKLMESLQIQYLNLDQSASALRLESPQI